MNKVLLCSLLLTKTDVMKIEILLLKNHEQLGEETRGQTCFEANDYIRKNITIPRSIYGVVIIDNIAVKFAFSCIAMDGDIFTDNHEHRTIIKHVVPVYVFANSEEISKFRD
jgi:hypothetical protein